MKNQTFALIAALLLTLSNLPQPSKSACTPGCTGCFKNGCLYCWHRLGTADHSCSAKLQPASDPCVQYKGTVCWMCKRGYTNDISKDTDSCFKHNIPNCLTAELRTQGNVCFTCDRGYPSPDYKSCLPMSQFNFSIANCEYGGRDTDQTLACYRCKPGFRVLTPQSGDSSGKRCVRNVQKSVKGCLAATVGSPLKCDLCDYWRGYYNSKLDGTCTLSK